MVRKQLLGLGVRLVENGTKVPFFCYRISATSENPTMPIIAKMEMKAQILLTSFLFLPVKIICVVLE